MVSAISRFQDGTAISNSGARIDISKRNSAKSHCGSTSLRSPTAPPFVVLKIVPLAPTAVPVLTSVNATLKENLLYR